MNDHFAEFGIIASVMDHPRIVSGVREALDPGDFLSEKNRVVWRSICELDDNGITPGWDTLLEHLTAAGDLPKVGGATGLAEMIDGVVRSDDVSPLIRMVKRLSLDHRAASAFEQVRLALEDGRQPSEVLAEYLPQLAALQGGTKSAGTGKPEFELLHWSELDQLPESEFLPGTHIIKRGFNMWYGLSGTAKSVAALRDGYHVSRLGLGAVVYVSPEGKAAWDLRRKAWSKHTGLEPGEMYFYPGAVNLMDDGEVSGFIADIKAKFPDGVMLIVFDTKSRMMPGADENGVQDDGVQVANSDRIKDGLKCAVLLIHHSNKADLSARGSGATTNACDCILKHSRDADDLITVSVTWPHGKLKDGEPWPDETFCFVKAGESVVLLPSDQVATEYSAKLTAQQTLVLQHAASEVFGDSGPTLKEIRAAIPISKVSESGLYAVLKTLISHGFLLHAAKSDPYQVTQAGRIKLSNSNGTLTPTLRESAQQLL